VRIIYLFVNRLSIKDYGFRADFSENGRPAYHPTEYAEYYEVNRTNVKNKESLYKRRQAIVEHPYVTIKRQWGFSYILTKKGMKRAGSDVGFMFIAYNLRRIGNILTREMLKEYLRTLVSLFFGEKALNGPKSRSFLTTFSRNRIWGWELTESLISA
jgi:hypothetical protein